LRAGAGPLSGSGAAQGDFSTNAGARFDLARLMLLIGYRPKGDGKRPAALQSSVM
jgi:hypothetical protein